jgi:hypothetical protein
LQADELLIRAKKENTLFELIPHSKLEGDFPKHLVDDNAHWMDIESQVIEFRPLSSQWVTSEDNPRVFYSYKDSEMRVQGKRFLDIRSQSASTIYSVLKPLEYSKFIEATLTGSGLEIQLPRFNLGFFAGEGGKLECLQFRNMVIDDNQDFGALIGLRNRLVLRDKDDLEDSHCRKVIIPHGTVGSRITGSHVFITIDTEQGKRVMYHVFDIDPTLRRLVGNSSLLSRLYKIYLHAMTSHCLPDPLIGRTGTEEALHELNSAAVWSFRGLDDDERGLLKKIADLTPKRVFYPKHLEVMQDVTWNGNLSPLSQHEDFYLTVRRIIEYSSRFGFFQEGDSPAPQAEKENTSSHLVERAAVRNCTFRLPEFGGSNLESGRDHKYAARDISSDDQAKALEAKVCAIARSAQDWSTALNTVPDLFQRFKGWKTVHCKSDHSLGYQSGLLQASLPEVWWSLYTVCRKATRAQRYDVMFMLQTLVYRDPERAIDMELVWTLLAFATDQRFERIAMPEDQDVYDLTMGEEPNSFALKETIGNHTVAYDRSPQSNAPTHSWESYNEWVERRRNLYREDRSQQIERLQKNLTAQWVCRQPAFNGSYSLLDISGMKKELCALFRHWYNNQEFKYRTRDIQEVLDSTRTTSTTLPTHAFAKPPVTPRDPTPLVSITGLCPRAIGVLASTDAPSLHCPEESSDGKVFRDEGLKALVDDLQACNTSDFERQYAQDLKDSLSVYRKQSVDANELSMRAEREEIRRFRIDCKKHMDDLFEQIKSSLEARHVDKPTQDLLESSSLWPRITPASLLALLATATSTELSSDWKRVLVHYGLAVTRFQWATRLYNLSQSRSRDGLAKELENQGHQNWDPMDHPDWMLIEIENNLLIRPVQADIAKLMISPRSGKSSVLQLNMGEGKSSVIVPIVSAELADGDKLVRVVVLKPLSTQMFRLLVQKLGGLTNRRIFYMPFNRSIDVDESIANEIRKLYEECVAVRGILLVQPEHLLSFKLMGFDKLDDPETQEVAEKLLKTQSWLEKKARDVLDESDEILHVRYQLIYTLGTQTFLDHAPERWVIMQHLLDLVLEHANKLQERFPKGVELHGVLPSSFPQLRILEEDAGHELLRCLLKDIENGRLPELQFRLWPDESMRGLALRFISDPHMTERERAQLYSYASLSNPKSLLLLRGVLAHGILLAALRDKRWRVDYGLDEKRRPPTLLAVPYRAKDCPALRAEFSHPDMAIMLTSLSYYYGGLTDAQMEATFTELLKSDDPGAEYLEWVDTKLPESIQTLKGVNIDDIEQRQTLIFPKLRHRKRVIDFYLTRIVFPRDAKEFPHKLSTSGWDLAEKRNFPTTGFSGTNDDRFLLPLSLKQDDVEQNRGTNAKVLSYLLKEENNAYRHVEVQSNEDKVDCLLEEIKQQSPEIRVLLDVGAQILSVPKSNYLMWMDANMPTVCGIKK